MKTITTIAKKEYWQYLTSPVGYIFAGLLLIVAGWLYFEDFFVIGQADLTAYWSSMTFLLSIFVPAISMNLIAEERKNSTWEVMLSLPINEIEYAIGKYLGAGMFLLTVFGLTLPTLITVFVLGQPDVGVLAGGLMGMILLALSYLSLGLFASSLSSQPIVGFLVGVVALLVNSVMGQESIVSRLPIVLKNLFDYLSLGWHTSNFYKGVISIGDLVFFFSWIVIFLTLTILSLKSRGK